MTSNTGFVNTEVSPFIDDLFNDKEGCPNNFNGTKPDTGNGEDETSHSSLDIPSENSEKDVDDNWDDADDYEYDEEADKNPIVKCIKKIQDRVQELHEFLSESADGYLYFAIFCVFYAAYFIAAMVYEFGDESSVRLLVCTILAVIILTRHQIQNKLEDLYYHIVGEEGMSPTMEKKFNFYRRIARWAGYLALLGVMIGVLIDEAVEDGENLRAVPGLVVMVVLSMMISRNPHLINWHTIIWSIGLQFIFAICVLRLDFGKDAMDWLQQRMDEFFSCTEQAFQITFGTNYMSMGLTFNSLPRAFLVSAVLTLLYDLGVMQFLVNVLGNFFSFVMDTAFIEALSVSGGIFVDGPLAVLALRPYLYSQSKSQLFTIIASTFASLGGTTVAIITGLGDEVLSSDSSRYESSSSDYEFIDDDICSSDSAWSDSEIKTMGINRKKEQSDESDSESIPLAQLVDSASFQRTLNSKPDNTSGSALTSFPSTSQQIRSTPSTSVASADSSETTATLETTSTDESLPSTSSRKILASGILIDDVQTPLTSMDIETHSPAMLEKQQNNAFNNCLASPEENESNNVVTSKGRKRSAKRVRNEKEWKRNINKRLRASGGEYVSSRRKVVPKREMGPVCSEKCQWKCGETPADERAKIFDAYWAIGDTTGQRQFIVHNAQSIQTKRPIQQEASRRKVSYIYHLKLSGETRRVCKTFFLNTLGIKEDIVYGAFKKVNDCGVLEAERRGGHGKQRCIPDEVKEHVRRHIASFPTVPSHYCRKSTSKQYLGSELNMSKMYSLYVEKCKEETRQPATRSMYGDIFYTSFSLAFHQPKKDQCDQCLAFDNSSNPSEEERATHAKHLHRKDVARAFKAQAKIISSEDPTVATGCFDLQQVLPCPRGEASSFYYRRKLAVYNLTVYDMETHAARCYMWPEHVSARGSNQVATCVLGYIKDMASIGKKTVYLFSDNCPGQNRNKGMASMLIFAINTVGGLNRIEHGFLEKGHTQNENDSVHAVIANAARGSVIYTPEQWYMLVRSARKRKAPYTVNEMSSADFMDFKKLSKNIKNLEFTDCGKKMNWTQIRSIRVERSDPFALHFKYEHDGEEMRVDLNRRKRNSTGNTDSLDLNLVPVKENCGITQEKKNDLLFLCGAHLIPAAYHDYFKRIPLKNADPNETDEEM